MATESEALFNKAKTGLRRVETVDRTKENPSLGRVLGAEERPEFRTSTKSAAKSKGQEVIKPAGPEVISTSKEYTSEYDITRDLLTGVSDEDPCLHADSPDAAPSSLDEDIYTEDLKEQLSILSNDMIILMKKLKLSEERIRLHEEKKDQNLAIQRDAGVKVSDLKKMLESKSEEKTLALEQEFDYEMKRADAHRRANEIALELANLNASQILTQKMQRIALERSKCHEKGIKYGETLKGRYLLQVELLKLQQRILSYEMDNIDILKSKPHTYHKAVDLKYEIDPEFIEEKRIRDDFTRQKGHSEARLDDEIIQLSSSLQSLIAEGMGKQRGGEEKL